jgi:hypothetical protein
MSTDEISLENIQAAIKALFLLGEVVELRIPKAKANGRNLGTISGYYDDHAELANDIKSVASKYTAVYYTLNPCEPSLISRSCNKSRENANETTQDSQIVRRRWLLLDVDPQRAAGISSSDEEKALAKEKTNEIHKYLKGQGWPRPLFGDSGNGYHLLYRIDLDNNSDVTALLKAVLVALASKFDTDKVKVDKSVYNAARIVKAYGSMAKKGEEHETQKRFHRVSKLAIATGGTECVTFEQLTAIAGTVEVVKTVEPGKKTGLVAGKHVEYNETHMRAFLDFYEIEVKSEGLEPDGRYKFILNECFFNPEHVNKDAAVFVGPTGLGYFCFHNSCSENHWRQFRDAVEVKFGKRFSFSTLKEAALTSHPADDEPVAEPERHIKMAIIDMSKMDTTKWLWKNRVPLGAVTVFSGDAGIGKTLMALDLSARLTTGADFIDGTKNDNDPAAVMFLSQEDDTNTIIGPRFLSADGDLKRLFMVQGVEGNPGEISTVNLDQDIKLIEKEVLANSDIKLIVIDPLMNYLGAKKGNATQDVRKIMMPLSDLAKEYQIAILLLVHHNKQQGLANALHKIGGSAAIGEVARMGWMFTKGEDHTTMSQIKCNLGQFHGIDFRTIGITIPAYPHLGEQAKVDYIGENLQSADDIAADRESRDFKNDQRATKREQMLKDVFKEQEKKYVDEFSDQLMKDTCCSWDTLCRMADKLGVYRNGKDGTRAYWTYRDDWGAK